MRKVGSLFIPNYGKQKINKNPKSALIIKTPEPHRNPLYPDSESEDIP